MGMVSEKKSTISYVKWDRGANREFSEEVTVLRMELQVLVIVCCIFFHMVEVVLPVPVHAVLITCLIEAETLEIPLWIWLIPCETTFPI